MGWGGGAVSMKISGYLVVKGNKTSLRLEKAQDVKNQNQIN